VPHPQIALQARTIRLPIHITEKLNQIKKVQRELAQKLGRSATTKEVAQELDLHPDSIREYFSIARQPISLDVRVGDNQDTELSELLEDNSNYPEKYITLKLMRQDIKKMLGKLTEQQRAVLCLRFGLEDGHEMSFVKISKRLNISRERVRQLERQALDKLRRYRANFREYITS